MNQGGGGVPKCRPRFCAGDSDIVVSLSTLHLFNVKPVSHQPMSTPGVSSLSVPSTRSIYPSGRHYLRRDVNPHFLLPASSDLQVIIPSSTPTLPFTRLLICSRLRLRRRLRSGEKEAKGAGARLPSTPDADLGDTRFQRRRKPDRRNDRTRARGRGFARGWMRPSINPPSKEKEGRMDA